jgi:hypothetical protein
MDAHLSTVGKLSIVATMYDWFLVPKILNEQLGSWWCFYRDDEKIN